MKAKVSLIVGQEVMEEFIWAMRALCRIEESLGHVEEAQGYAAKAQMLEDKLRGKK